MKTLTKYLSKINIMAKTCIRRAQRSRSRNTWPKIEDPITGELKPMSAKRTITLHYPNPIDKQAKATAKAARIAKMEG